MKCFLIAFSIIILSSCTANKNPETLQEGIIRSNIENLCNSVSWIGRYQKYTFTDTMITCYEISQKGEVLSKVEILRF